jgi:hypothetical protein
MCDSADLKKAQKCIYLAQMLFDFPVNINRLEETACDLMNLPEKNIDNILNRKKFEKQCRNNFEKRLKHLNADNKG